QLHGRQTRGVDAGLLAELPGHHPGGRDRAVRRFASAGMVAVLVAMGAVGCTSAPHRIPRGPPSSAPPSRAPVVRLPPIELPPYLSERPGRWDPVTTIPFGADESSLLFQPEREAPTVEPSSFAIAGDGTIWILDAGNARIAHYSRAGRFLGAI